MKKKIYISHFSGLGNRLEALVLATMIEDRFGHSIFLDWPEKASLHIAGTSPGRLTPWDRIGALKLRDFDEERLRSLGNVRVINLRACYGPRELQRRYVLPTAARLKPEAGAAAAIRETLRRFGNRPAVGVHLRRGDFHVFEDGYDALAHRHPVPALWWYAHVMQAYVRAFPDVYFVLAASGDAQETAQLSQRFETVSLPAVFDYEALLPGHRSAGHPVIDLFGLACCTTLIATPTSSFSHWAANMLGPRTRTILPPPRMTKREPAFGVAELWGSVVLDWRDAAERGIGVVPIKNHREIPRPTPAVTDWLD